MRRYFGPELRKNIDDIKKSLLDVRKPTYLCLALQLIDKEFATIASEPAPVPKRTFRGHVSKIWYLLSIQIL